MKQQRKNSFTEANRYTFVQKDGDDFTCIKLTDKKYNGVIYRYDDVGFAKEENADGKLPMRFKYDIFKNPNKVDIDNQEFIDYIGDILIELLEKQLTDGKIEFK